MNTREANTHKAAEMHRMQTQTALLLQTLLWTAPLQKMLHRIHREKSPSNHSQKRHVRLQ